MSLVKKKILFIYNNPAYEKRINYVLDFIEQHPLALGAIHFTRQENEGVNLKLTYGIEQPGSFFIPSQKFIFSNAVPGFDSLYSNEYSFGPEHVYAVELQQKERGHFIQNNRFQFDILETIFFHISRFEEWHYLGGREDKHGRMDARQQFLVKNKLHRNPVVDQLVACFLKAMGIEIPDQKTRYRITHDIDFIERKNDFFHLAKSMGGAVLKRGNFSSAFRIWCHRNDKNPYDTFDWMLRKEREIEKVIYFLVGGKSAFDNSYDLRLPVFKKAVELSKARGYRIGIHPSYESWKDQQLFSEELERLQNATGEEIDLSRQHFLRFSFQNTPKIIEKLSLEEDSSLGFADRIGFRCGTGFGYRLYDFEQEKAFNFLETPLVFMDSALFAEAKNQPEVVQKIWDAFISANRFNTKITFNFHNSRFYDAQINGIPLRALYESLFSRENAVS